MPADGERDGAAPSPPVWLLRIAAGLDAGGPAALAVLAWFAIHSRLLQEPWWSKFNIAAAPFFGDRVFILGPGRATLAGAALLFLLYSILGLLYALLAGERGAARASFLAVLWMTSWHLIAQQYFWPRLDPAAAPYFPLSATVPAHVAAAILLVRFPARYRRLRSLAGLVEQPVAPAAGPADPGPSGSAAGDSSPASPGSPEAPPPAARLDC